MQATDIVTSGVHPSLFERGGRVDRVRRTRTRSMFIAVRYRVGATVNLSFTAPPLTNNRRLDILRVSRMLRLRLNKIRGN
jgi:hypothetical protein